MQKRVFIFDLDDTLYKEVDFLKSAYREIAKRIGIPEAYDIMLDNYRRGENAFQTVIEECRLPYTVEDLLAIYRNHVPEIALNETTVATLDSLKGKGVKMGLMTDGRTITQRNKIKVLGLSRWIGENDILISEEFGYGKPDIHCYEYFMNRYPEAVFSYVGDNLSKDFVTANRLGWTTICLLDDGRNIFKQDFDIDESYLPKHKIFSINEVLSLI